MGPVLPSAPRPGTTACCDTLDLHCAPAGRSPVVDRRLGLRVEVGSKKSHNICQVESRQRLSISLGQHALRYAHPDAKSSGDLSLSHAIGGERANLCLDLGVGPGST